ncbi:uncharacterized protein LOC112452469 [Temnothorax curvispinosus]|uniref:Uncharacterized protein LOC112452469 n=1 Tax=Temnothorax curvispinosus TaxID=300111 RepID=A0A6J1PG16_9HYME|nr:uncharacterized protein LOC112452469 [Temnothorax curvispinosus]
MYNKNSNDYITLSKRYCYLITGAPSSIRSTHHDQKECTLERFPQDLPKYVALKDLFSSQDKYVKLTLTNREQPYESFYDLGLTADYSFIEGNNCENAGREFDAMQITNYIERELNTIYTKNGTNIDSSCLDTKPSLHSCDGVHSWKNECSV